MSWQWTRVVTLSQLRSWPDCACRAHGAQALAEAGADAAVVRLEGESEAAALAQLRTLLWIL